MGRVVEATDTLLGRTVAVKEALALDGEALRRFRRETRITARLEHPSIVPVHDAGTSPDGSPFYVMRRVSGRPLEQLVASTETLGERLALLPHIVAAAQAVAHAHRRGVIHRDLKPSNVLVGDLGETVVIDWGLAKVIDEPDDDAVTGAPALDAGSSLRTRVGTVFGTPGFMPVEQLRGEPVDARSDVYALGATLYFMLARQAPHTAESETAMMSAAAIAPATPIRDVISGVPPPLSTIIDKALAFRSEDRYRDAGELAEDLQRYVAGQLVAAHHYTPRERFMRFVKKHRISVAIAGIAIAALTIGGALAFRKIVTERDRADAQARAAEDRSEQLQLNQARVLVATNPTAAVAMLKQLATPDRWGRLWQRARDIAAGARANGVAVALPGPETALNLELSKSGKHAYIEGGDQAVWIYDLVHRTHRVVKLDTRAGIAAAGDSHVLAVGPTEIVVVDVTTGATRTIPLDRTLLFYDATETAIYGIDEAGLWRRPIDGGAPKQLRLPWPGPILWMAVSHDEHYLGLGGKAGAAIYDLTTPQPEPHTISTRMTALGRWDDLGKAIGVTYIDKAAIGSISIDGNELSGAGIELPMAVTQPVGTNLYALTYDRGLFVVRNGKLQTMRFDAINQGAGLHVASHERLVSLAGSHLLITRNRQTTELVSPIEGVTRIAAVPTSSVIAASASGHLLIWNLDDIVPYETKIVTATNCYMVDPRNLLANVQGSWAWIDRDRPLAASVELPPLVEAVNWNRSLKTLVIANGTATLLAKKGDTLDVTTIGDGYLGGRVADDGHVILATHDGTIVDYDPVAQWTTPLRAERASIAGLELSGPWVFAAFDHGILWRFDRRTAVGTTRTGGEHIAGGYPIAGAGDGRLISATKNRIEVWHTDGTVSLLASLPIDALGVRVTNDLVLVDTADGGHVYDLDTGAITAALPAGVWIAMGLTDLASYRIGDNTLGLVDLRTGEMWPLTHTGSTAASPPSISDDGGAVCSIEGSNLFVWDTNIPDSPDATVAWLAHLTNATAELGTASLTWH